jgi:hypothetical protein
VGVLKQLVLLPLAPVRGVVWLTERVGEVAELQLRDPDTIRAHLLDAQLAYERGEIDEIELEEIEETLVRRLEVP